MHLLINILIIAFFLVLVVIASKWAEDLDDDND